MGRLNFGGQAAGLEGIIFLAGHGFDFADLNLNEIDKIRREEREVIKAAHKAGMFFVAHGPDLRVDNPEGLARIEEAVRYAELFKPKTITIHPILAAFSNTPETIKVKLREIARLQELSGSYGSRISCENTAEGAADMKVLLDALPDVMLTVDIGHSELLSEKNKSLDFINAYPDRIGHADGEGGSRPCGTTRTDPAGRPPKC